MSEHSITVPGDKSISHRALILNALASGRSRIRGALDAGDTRATAQALRALGLVLPPLASEIVLAGLGTDGLRYPERTLDCANSGTTARLMLGLLAGSPVWAVLTGDASLRARPMRRVTAPLARAGARFAELGAPDRLPIAVQGSPLAPIRHDSPHASAQVKSALLLAGLVAGAPVAVTEPSASRDHTERMLAAMGAGITSANGDGRHPIRFEPADALTAIDIDVPGDFSSAAFFLAAAVLRTRGSIRIEHVGVNPTRIGLLPVIERMGVRVRVENERSTGGEPVADLVAQSTALTGTVVEADEVPGMIDEIPVLAILAARAHGETRVTGAAELRVKESDRIASLVRNLREIGVRAEELDDGFVIEGTDAPLAGRVDTAGDHRIAMAFGVLGILPRSHIVVDDPGAASVSYPAFWSQLNALGERGR